MYARVEEEAQTKHMLPAHARDCAAMCACRCRVLHYLAAFEGEPSLVSSLALGVGFMALSSS